MNMYKEYEKYGDIKDGILRVKPSFTKVPFYSLTETPNRYQEYQGLYYKYDKWNNVWMIATQPDEMAYLWWFNADIYRLDQCFEKVKEELKQMDLMRGEQIKYNIAMNQKLKHENLHTKPE